MEEQAATDEYDTAENIAFAKLYEYICRNIFEEPQVMKIANLTMKVIEWIKTGLTEMKDSIR